MIDTTTVCGMCNGLGSSAIFSPINRGVVCSYCDGKGEYKTCLANYLRDMTAAELLGLTEELRQTIRKYGGEPEEGDGNLIDAVCRLNTQADRVRDSWDERNGVIR